MPLILGGYLFGFSTAIALLAIGILARTDLDALFLFKQYRRRAEMRAATREFGSGFDGTTSSTPIPSSISRSDVDSTTAPPPPLLDEHAEVRRTITSALRQSDTDAALAAYQTTPPGFVLSDADQAELGNRAVAAGDAETAVKAYVALLERRGERNTGPGGSSDEIRLLLASMLIRRLARPKDARPHLEALDDRPLSPEGIALRDALKAEMNDA